MRTRPDGCLDTDVIDYSPSFKSTVKQIDENGDIIKIWESSSEAARHLNCDNSSIIKCANGKIVSYKGFKWEFVSNIKYKIISEAEQKEIIEYYISSGDSVIENAKMVLNGHYTPKDNGDIIEVDRSLFNKCMIIDNYRLIDEIEPTIDFRHGIRESEIHECWNCGKLIIERI